FRGRKWLIFWEVGGFRGNSQGEFYFFNHGWTQMNTDGKKVHRRWTPMNADAGYAIGSKSGLDPAVAEPHKFRFRVHSCPFVVESVFIRVQPWLPNHPINPRRLNIEHSFGAQLLKHSVQRLFRRSGPGFCFGNDPGELGIDQILPRKYALSGPGSQTLNRL